MSTAPISATILMLSAGHGAVSRFLAEPEPRRALAVITAARPAIAANGPPPWLEASLSALARIGLDVETYDITGKDQTEIRQALDRHTVLYVSGGNSFFLLQSARQSGFDQCLKHFLSDARHLYIGASAGAVILGPDIAWANVVDDPSAAPELANTAGLHYVDFAPIPHADTDDSGVIIDKAIRGCVVAARDAGLTAIPFTDSDALVVQRGTVQRIASGTVD